MQAFPCTVSPFPGSLSSLSASCSAAAAAASPAASAAAGPSFQSAETAARLPSAAAAAAAVVPAAAAVVKPFDRDLFRAFIAAASRLFCDDEQIVVIDFLAHHEKAFTERELSDRLRWGERRVREACAALERLMLVAKEQLVPSGGAGPRRSDNYSDSLFGLQAQDAHGGGQQQQGASAPSYYRVSPFCLLVFHYRLQRMEQQVETQRRNAESRDIFFCPACRTQYDALEAQLLDVHPQDAHFLCKFCNERLEHEDSKLLLQQAMSLQERCEKQLQTLKTLVRRGWNMQIPTFPPFTRAEKNQQKLKSSEEEEKHKKGMLALHGDNLNSYGEDMFLKQQQATGVMSDGRIARPQPSWITGDPGRRRDGDATQTHTPATGTAGVHGQSKASLYVEGNAGRWGQQTNNKGILTAANQADAAGRLQQLSGAGPRVGAGAPPGRHQIKFAMKSTVGKPASVIGSRLRAAHTAQHTGAVSSPDRTGGKNRPSAASVTALRGADGNAAAAADTAAGTGKWESDSNVTSPAQSTVDAAHGVTREAAAAVQHTQQQQDEDRLRVTQQAVGAAGIDNTADAIGACLPREELSTAASADIDAGPPLIYVSRMGREMTLEEAADYQQEMTSEEHEKFMELQAMYVDEI